MTILETRIMTRIIPVLDDKGLIIRIKPYNKGKYNPYSRSRGYYPRSYGFINN